ncbi:MAG: family hydrolase [Bacillales bacterium]|jgi:putative hydrolase of the HAD superfamily|nr:family hydrolase [Bacillales bacterium]
MIKALIFDFDGIIIDTEVVWYEAYKEFLIDYGIELTVEKFSEVVGSENDVLNAYILENTLKPIEIETLEEKAWNIVQEKLEKPVAMPGVISTLKSAKEKGLRLAIASSSNREWIVNFLNKIDALEYFEIIKSREDVSKVKPDPELYLSALRALELEPNEAIIFEDSLNGLKAANAANIPCIIIPCLVTKHLPFEGHALRLSSMSEIQLDELIEKIETLYK